MLKSVFRKLNHSLILLLLLAVTTWAQSAAPATAAKEVEVYGQKIHYLEAGAGPVVILLHGLGGDSTNWALTLPALSANYRVIAPDQIGFGKLLPLRQILVSPDGGPQRFGGAIPDQRLSQPDQCRVALDLCDLP